MNTTPPDKESVYLIGDEDGGVMLCCRVCPDSGRPLVYYGPKVDEQQAMWMGLLLPEAKTIAELAKLAADHESKHAVADRLAVLRADGTIPATGPVPPSLGEGSR
jgi:hypothetical protein